MSADELDSDINGVRVYRIRVKEQRHASWSDWLGGIAVLPQCDGSTLLAGPVDNQSGLEGILSKQFPMILTLLSVE